MWRTVRTQRRNWAPELIDEAYLRRRGSAPLFVSSMSEDGVRRLEGSSGGRDPRSRGKYRIEMRRGALLGWAGGGRVGAPIEVLARRLRKRSRSTPSI